MGKSSQNQRTLKLAPNAWVRVVLLAMLCCPNASARAVDAEPPSHEIVAAVLGLVDAGKFDAANAQIHKALDSTALTRSSRRALEFQRERMRRILMDFSLTLAQVQARVKKDIPDLSDNEFMRWNAAGLFEHKMIDGKTWYFNRSPSNLFRLSAEAVARRAQDTPLDNGPTSALNANHRNVRAAALASGSSSVLPKRVRVTHSLSVDAGAVPAGEKVRAWIPYPRALPGQQENIKLLRSEPGKADIAPESALQRTVYLEKIAQAGEPTEFSITYEVTIAAQYHELAAEKLVPFEITPKLAPFLAERPPHVVFTEDMRAFSRKVVGEETNPYRIAQKLYAAVDRIPWAGAREYSTISNISDYTLHAGHGDCGQQTLLLITLLRMNGIPARWQSGWTFTAGSYNNIHDWAFMYLAPYGWVPVDVTYGRFADAEPAMEWFYLGSLDGYRIAFNDGFSRDFVPAKEHFRSDNVDSQRGEVEWSGGNLYYDQWDYGFEWQILPQAMSFHD